MIKKLDSFFIGDKEDVTAIDRIFFYGTYTFLFTVAGFTWLSLLT